MATRNRPEWAKALDHALGEWQRRAETAEARVADLLAKQDVYSAKFQELLEERTIRQVGLTPETAPETVWKSWAAAFQEATGRPDGLRLVLTPDAFAAALDSLTSAWLSNSTLQEACRSGLLERWDPHGRRVVLFRKGATE